MAYTKWQQNNIDKGLCPLCANPKSINRLTCRDCRKRIYETGKTRQQLRTAGLRDAVLTYYGGKCECCEENRRPFLAVDHKPGTSREGDQRNLTEWLVSHNFPPGFRILCHNCNMATRWGRVCPHKQ